MHHLFRVDEILRSIAGHVVDAGHYGSALSLACCCKTISAPVLDVMWEGQTNFVTALKILPRSVWTVTGRTLVFSRRPSEEEWNHFSGYAGRMRNLSIASHDVALAPSVFGVLRQRFYGRCMFPNLRKLEWTNWELEWSHELIPTLVVSSNLINIELSLGSTHLTRAVLSALAPEHHKLRVIRINQNNPELVPDFSALLLKYKPQLLDFHVSTPISRAGFLCASQLPNLRVFDIKTVQVGGQEPPGGTSLPKTMFPSVQHLYVRGFDINSIWLPSFKRIGSKNLEVLMLELEEGAMARTALHLALKNLHTSGSHRTLKELMVDHLDFSFPLGINGETVERLLSFTQLTTLVFSKICGGGQCGYHISDEDLEKLVKAMPKLEYLALGTWICPRPPNNTIKSLISISRHCRNLEKLFIHIDSEVVITGPFDCDDIIPRGNPTVVCPLRLIAFSPSLIPDGQQGASKFALRLLRMFPNLDKVVTITLGPQWEFVDEIIALSRRNRPVIPARAGEPILVGRLWPRVGWRN